MSCCATNVPKEAVDYKPSVQQQYESFLHSGHETSNGTTRFTISVPDIHCGACISAIEHALNGRLGIVEARVNLTLKRLNLEIDDRADLTDILSAVEKLGFRVSPIDMGDLAEFETGRRSTELLKAMAVAGFASMNIMLLSVSVWSGAEATTRDLFHIISALIAVPVVVYSGQVFFRSAFGALKVGRLNMDVPISLAVILALSMSIFETVQHGSEAYFDAATMLLFFLLIGRYLDEKMREKARNSVVALSKLAAKGANRVLDNGKLHYIAADEIKPGMVLRLLPGDRVPADGIITNGSTDFDRSHVTGESAPIASQPGQMIEAGALNLTGVVNLTVDKSADKSFLAEIGRMLEAAEKGRGLYTGIADRMARIYAPAVHLLALTAFLFWLFYSGGDWHLSLTTAIAVLIITCPCALGLAVPVTHVVAASRLMKAGILMRDGSAIERLADIKTAVFDKTGTLTTGTPVVASIAPLSDLESSVLKALAHHSNHPASRAIDTQLKGVASADLSDLKEYPGFGVEGVLRGKRARLGRANWACDVAPTGNADKQAGLLFVIEGAAPVEITLQETVRDGAKEAVSQLAAMGISSQVLSGDSHQKVADIAHFVGANNFQSERLPADKFKVLTDLEATGEKSLMVGDGINDAPALRAAHVSMAPVSAADVGRAAADFIFTQDSLTAVPFALEIARRCKMIIKQNFGLAIAYNIIAVPLAFAGYVTPLFAAIAMSASSILVVANSMRLQTGSGAKKLKGKAAPVTVSYQTEKASI